ncbi:HflC protein [Bathymodiolus thermophilus thioautotrophic gill symbiont]|uniref:Protein HflC n=1 Tax=Bathymodiolus thermophilus thioautotrophic gill symbiont TaxID=2360 RepID=A0A1J5TWD2_9GAMM|nr:protease modulator HflC [Bathymodiolus thermophilus thioautotrophic gill symbiont]OIR25152.1 HflC protein [Bathymodiolus thermophilus thioautotrophic gill symbiont]CAB5497760.1 HflC protein [Bathymodiolus thermophilus thioautotrophic gill symbiont]CAB5504276.1 HflC protein [Bathymodiolus thermophilus thioautotrophic gill symbiont]SGZ63482.1 HflC protein [Bathymodiolus thermophilus thioautotrophic gill symbiont]
MKKMILIILVILLFVVSSALYTVSETQIAVKLRLGEIITVDQKPGLKFKTPFVNNVVKFDNRIQTLDAPAERFLTGEKKNVNVDYYVKWRIIDAEQFYKSTGGNMVRTNNRLAQIIKTGLKSEFSKRTIADVVFGERSEIMVNIKQLAKKDISKFGIEIIDVRIKRIDLSQEVLNSVYRRMQAERHRVAKEFRSKGAEEAEIIRAAADKERTIILANAYRDSEKIRGEGDAASASNYAEAYNKDAEFYSFYRALESYKKSFTGRNDIMVLNPNTEFFRYFK